MVFLGLVRSSEISESSEKMGDLGQGAEGSGTSKLLVRVRSEVQEHERMWIGTIGQQIITLDFVTGLASAN